MTIYICAFCDIVMWQEVGYCEGCGRIDGALTSDEWWAQEVALAVYRAYTHA